MATTQDNRIADLQRTIAELRQERDTARVERDAALAQRSSEYGERIEHQAATIDVLKVMSASPGDPQPVFDLIVRRAQELCNSKAAGIYEYDGELVHLRSDYGARDIAGAATYIAAFPMVPIRGSIACRAILDKQVVHIRDTGAEQELLPSVRDLGIKSALAIPLLRDGAAIGAFIINSLELGGFSDSQVALSQTFAEQAVIAISSAGTYRGLHETLEQQTATAEVLQVINSSPGNLTPVFAAMLEKAMMLCGAAFGSLYTYDGECFHSVAQRGVPTALVEFRAKNPPSGQARGSAAPLVETKRPVHILDMTEEEFYRTGDDINRATVDLGGARTTLTVPLLKDRVLLGAISIYRQEVRAFSNEQIALLENFAAQAVIAMENARLIAEQREALEQQTATAEVLQVINASPGSLAPVFEAMLEKAMRLCGGTIGGIFTFDGDHSVTSAVRGVTGAFEQYNNKHPMDKIQPGTLPARIIETRGPVQYADVTAGDPYRAGHPYARAIVELGGIRAALAVPFLKDGVAVGMVAIYRQEVGAFSDKQIVLLQNFADQAVIAMESARLLTEQREALEQQTATAEVLQVINASPGNLGPVFEAMLEKAMRLCDAAFGSLYTYDGERFHSAAQRGLPEAFAEFRAQNPLKPVPGSQLARAIENRQTLQVLDLECEDLYREGNPFVRAMVDLGGVRTILTVPLCRDETVLGFLSVYRQEVRAFSDKQIALLENFAAQAVIAMENARLINEQQDALEQQTATAEVLGVINASPGNLAPVFDAMLEKVLRLCEVPIRYSWHL